MFHHGISAWKLPEVKEDAKLCLTLSVKLRQRIHTPEKIFFVRHKKSLCIKTKISVHFWHTCAKIDFATYYMGHVMYFFNSIFVLKPSVRYHTHTCIIADDARRLIVEQLFVYVLRAKPCECSFKWCFVTLNISFDKTVYYHSRSIHFSIFQLNHLNVKVLKAENILLHTAFVNTVFGPFDIFSVWMVFFTFFLLRVCRFCLNIYLAVMAVGVYFPNVRCVSICFYIVLLFSTLTHFANIAERKIF